MLPPKLLYLLKSLFIFFTIESCLLIVNGKLAYVRHRSPLDLEKKRIFVTLLEEYFIDTSVMPN